MSSQRPAALGAALLVALLACVGNAAAEDILQLRHTTQVEAGAREVQAIRAWIAANTPAHAPQLQDGRWRVSRTTQQTATQGQRAPGASPPVPLPATGAPGDEVSISHSRNGGHESWTFRWSSGSSGGRWVLVAYQFKAFEENTR